ncbi:hypothetical protein GCM10009827_108930 [Dactylosporangium maewongense]|uniref:Uncharacterized protein n=1 Tax=Dactylosporangium maewongense TaxID=634393 RepID=A0ABP4NYW0_9ACTN
MTRRPRQARRHAGTAEPYGYAASAWLPNRPATTRRAAVAAVTSASSAYTFPSGAGRTSTGDGPGPVRTRPKDNQAMEREERSARARRRQEAYTSNSETWLAGQPVLAVKLSRT